MFLNLLIFSWPASAQTNEPPALVPAYGEITTPFWEEYQVALIVGGAVVVAYVLFVLKMMLRLEIPVILPAEVVARQSLLKLQDQPEDGTVLSAVSQILRCFVSETFHLPDRELTTAEFCADIEANLQIGAELAGATASFLHECDARKFSPTHATAPLNAVKRALELVERIEKRRVESTAQLSVPK